MELLPSLEQIAIENSTQTENKFIPGRRAIAKELDPLIKFIDFEKLKVKY